MVIRAQDDTELVPQTFRLPRGLIQRLLMYAAQHDTTQHEVVAAVVREHLDKMEGKQS
jgi:hypothetical protein